MPSASGITRSAGRRLRSDQQHRNPRRPDHLFRIASHIVLNPMFILSDFSFPISSMREVLQWITYVDPLRYFLVIIRGTYLKGVGMDVLWPQMLALAALGLGLFLIAVMRFRKSLD
jgi:ABC-2 type transport system permease protein